MPSAASRGQLVLDALALAGRSTELKQSCNQWLNYALRDLGLTFQFPELRKTGAAQVLAIGQSTSPLPADIGIGMAQYGMIFGADNRPMSELSFEEFATRNGFPTNGTGRPASYIVDKSANVFRFSCAADQVYPFTPTYFMQPPLLPIDTSADNLQIWLDNDAIAVHALMWWIYIFTEDAREDRQAMLVEKMVAKWQRQITKLGGTSRILPSPSRFKTVLFGGQYGV